MPEQSLQTLRTEIDAIDEQIIALLAARFAATRQVGALKARAALPAVDPDREANQERRYRQLAEGKGLDPDLVAGVFRLVIDEVVRQHRKV